MQNKSAELPTLHLMWLPGHNYFRDRNAAKWITGKYFSGKVCVHADRERKGNGWNHRQIVQCALQDGKAWSLVIQDDAIPCAGWEDHLKRVQETAVQPFVRLYFPGNYGKALADKGVPYGYSKESTAAVAVLFERENLKNYARFTVEVEREFPGFFYKWDDILIEIYNMVAGTYSAITARNLVRLLDVPSTLGNPPARDPDFTIEDPGPEWEAEPRERSAGLYPGDRTRFQPILERMREKWSGKQ